MILTKDDKNFIAISVKDEPNIIFITITDEQNPDSVIDAAFVEVKVLNGLNEEVVFDVTCLTKDKKAINIFRDTNILVDLMVQLNNTYGKEDKHPQENWNSVFTDDLEDTEDEDL